MRSDSETYLKSPFNLDIQSEKEPNVQKSHKTKDITFFLLSEMLKDITMANHFQVMTVLILAAYYSINFWWHLFKCLQPIPNSL